MQLYLGLDPPKTPGVFGYPVIYTKKRKLNKRKGRPFSHVLFTSKRSVEYFFEEESFSGVCVAIGEGTAKSLKQLGKEYQIASEATQEGVMGWVEKEHREGFSYLYPKSSRARGDLEAYLQKRSYPYESFVLYDTYFQKPLPIPRLEDFEEIFFTSPSTVEAFFQIFETIPKGIQCKAIGPITRHCLKRYQVPNIV